MEAQQNLDVLREQVMINRFVMAAGCTMDQARQMLVDTQWQYERALSIFFQEASGPCCHHGNLHPMCAPANTPATPPNFPETLLSLQKLGTSASDRGQFLSASPALHPGGFPQSPPQQNLGPSSPGSNFHQANGNNPFSQTNPFALPISTNNFSQPHCPPPASSASQQWWRAPDKWERIDKWQPFLHWKKTPLNLLKSNHLKWHLKLNLTPQKAYIYIYLHAWIQCCQSACKYVVVSISMK